MRCANSTCWEELGTECIECGDTFCDDCIIYCSDCGEPYCDLCIGPENLCPACEEVKGKEEEEDDSSTL